MAEISIIVPTLNEALNIDQLLERTISVSATLMEYSFEIILVDDNSTDGTREKVSRWLSDPRIKLIHRCDEKGLASAIFAGAKAAKSEVLVIMDADLSHPPETIPELVEPIIADEKDMVIGSRYSAGGATSEWPLSRKIASKLATLAARVLTDIHDPLSGYFAIQKQQLLSLGRDVPGFKIGLEVIVKGGESLRVAEIPITFQDRKRGGSKFNLPIIMAYGRHIASLAGGNINMGTGMRFGLIGCLGFIIDYAIFHTLCQAGIGLGQANFISFTVAALSNYMLNMKWAFADPLFKQQNVFRQYLVFLTIALMALFLRGGILALLVRTWHWPVSIAFVVAMGTAAIFNYLGTALLVIPRYPPWPMSEYRWRVVAVIIIGYSILLRGVYLGLPELLHQEAYYWNYGQHMALSYLDHPPLLAWLIRCSTELFGTKEWAIRLIPFLCWMITATYSYQMALSLFSRSTAFKVLLLVAVLPAFFSTGFLGTPDAPLIACWAGALFYLQRALIYKKGEAWYGFGIALGLGVLSKYTIILLVPGIAVYLMVNGYSRQWFTRPEPYIAIFLSLLLSLPVILWNADNNWASFIFQGPRRFMGSFKFALDDLLGSILLLLTPTGFLVAVTIILGKNSLLNQIGRKFSKDEGHLFSAVFTLTPLTVFIFFSLFREVKLNWTAPIWLALLPFLAQTMVAMPVINTSRFFPNLCRTWMGTILCTQLFFGAMLYHSVLGIPGLPYPGDRPFLLGWGHMANHLEEYQNSLEKVPLVVGLDKYRIASGLSFYRKKIIEEKETNKVTVKRSETAGRNFFGKNSLMYAFWFPNEQYVGRDMILVSDKMDRLIKKRITDSFDAVDPIQEFQIQKNGKPVKTYYYRLGRDYCGANSAYISYYR